MDINKLMISAAGRLNLDLLKKLLQQPEPFTPGEELFWDDPHISKGMLEAHLNPTIDAASRSPETIEKTVNNLIDSMNLTAGGNILDLGCGPGLYCKHFAQRGFAVTGLDYSKRSIEYGTLAASDLTLEINYVYMNYLDMEYCQQFDAVLLIYGDLCVLPGDKRNMMLRKVRNALKPGGRFAFDVTTRAHRRKNCLKNGWYVTDSGFWKPGPHLVLENGFDYPEENLYLDQYVVIEESGKVSIYRNWFRDYSLEEITVLLEEHSFIVEKAWADLTGQTYRENSEWIGIIAGLE